MSGKYIQGKIHYTSPIYNFLTKGNWKNGFSGKPEIAFYEIANQFDENTIEI